MSHEFKWPQNKPWLSTVWLDVSDVIDAVSAYIRVFVNVNVTISNELNFSNVYRSVNYIGSLAKLHEPLWGSFTLHVTQCSLQFDKPQKNEIHSLNNFIYTIIKEFYLTLANLTFWWNINIIEFILENLIHSVFKYMQVNDSKVAKWKTQENKLIFRMGKNSLLPWLF